MGKVDTLSRREDHAVGVADDNKGVTVISPSQVHSLPIIDVIKKKIFDTLVTWTETEVYLLCKEKGICEEHDGFLYDSSGWMYVPDNDSLCMHIMIPIMIPLLLDTRATRKPKNSLNDNIIGLGWPRTCTLTSLNATVVPASKEVTRGLPALPFHFSQAQCLGWTSVRTSSRIFCSPTGSTPSSLSLTTSQKKPSSFRATRPPQLWTPPSSIYFMSGRIMASHAPLLVIEDHSSPRRS